MAANRPGRSDKNPRLGRFNPPGSANTPVEHEGGPAQQPISPDLSVTVSELNGQHIKLPGFIVPLDSDREVIREFLLVPYYGACLHEPPPPVNQIVHVYYAQGISNMDLRYPVWMQGVISTGEVSSELAVAGYSMDGTATFPYQGE
jgi:hypothetical protein